MLNTLMDEAGRAIANEAPAPLPIKRPWPAPLAEEAFHGIAGDIVRAIEPHSEADLAGLLMDTLVSLGSAIGRGPHAIVEADRHGCNLNAVTVGQTSKARKGVVRGRIHSVVELVDSTWAQECVKSGLASGEGLKHAVRDAVEREEDGEMKVTDPGVSDKRLLVVETEFASVLKVATRDGSTLSTSIRQAWDTGTLRDLTKHSPEKATGAHISIIGHITRDELLKYLCETEAANGFANRFLWLCVRRSKVLPDGGGDLDFHEIVPRLHDILERAYGTTSAGW